MSEDRAKLVKELFLLAAECSPSDRDRFLWERCPDDSALRAEICALLGADEAVLPEFLAGATPARETLTLPARIGRYQILRRIGQGGMGEVFEAVQDSPRRTVALKLLRGGLFSPDALRRFEYESQILANLVHAGIAQVYESGTHRLETGATVPFFAMELIPGAQPITDYARASGLKTRQRLALFAEVCDAVQFGHQKAVVHRDLKPANIVVDSSGRPRIIDFGVARSLGGEGMAASQLTSAGQIIGTLAYMSPEQIGGADPRDLDVRSDVYSLGVVLYELLCERLPYDVGRGDVVLASRVVREQSPVRPSVVHRQLRGDIQTIILKALEKDRTRRYQTAGDLARDVRLYLDGEPIEAKHDSALYVLRKTMWRYRLALGVAAGFVLLMLGSSIVAWTLRGRARDAASAAAQSEAVAQTRLRDALIAEARAIRGTGRIGQRFEAIESLRKSAAIGPTVEARSEAIAAMALPDLRLVRQSKQSGTGCFDSELKRCAVMDHLGSFVIARVEDDTELARIPGPAGGQKEMYCASLTGRFLVRIFDPPAGDRRLEVWALPALDAPPEHREGDSASPSDVTARGAARGETLTVDRSLQGIGVFPRSSAGEDAGRYSHHGPLGQDARLHLELTDVPYLARYDISPDGRRLAVGRTDGAIHIYDLESAQEVQRIALDRHPSYLSFDPAGRRLALYHGNYLAARILDLESGESEPAFDSDSISWSVAWHPDGKLLAGAAGNRIEFWDAERRSSSGVLAGHEDQVVWIRFSPDGTMLLSYSWEGESFLWDARTRRPLLRCRMVPALFSPDGARVGCAAFGSEPHGQILELSGAPERRRLADAGHPESIVVGKGLFEPVTGLLLVANVGAAEVSGMRVCDPVRGRELARHAGTEIKSLAIDRRGQRLLTGGIKGLFAWPIRSDGPVITIGPAESLLPDTWINSVDVSADGGRAVAVTEAGGEFLLLEPRKTVGVRRFACSIHPRSTIRISPDGRWAAWGGWDVSTGEVWDLENGEPVLELPAAYDAGVAFSTDGRRFVSSDLNGLCLWETGIWKRLRTVRGQNGNVQLSPDGRLIAAAAADPTIVRLLDADTLEELARLEPPESYLTEDIAFSPDGALVAQITNRAGVVHVWDLRRIREQLVAMGLDWDQPPYPPAPTDRQPRVRVQVASGELRPGYE